MTIALITGVSSGIGRATAIEMANQGYHVVTAGRSEERTMATVEAIRHGGGSAEFLQLDLASLASSEKAANVFVDSGRTLDVLINNAGVGAVRGLTEDGFEIHFGVNHLGHFALTHHLRPSFRQGTRVVVVSSEAHRHAKGVDFDRIRRKTGITDLLAAYGVSKLANILFARRLAQHHPDFNTYSVHPGVADTNIFPTIVKPFLRNMETPEEAAQTSVWCAASDQVGDQSGLYYSRMKVREPSPVARQDDLATELWRRSEEWCGIAPG